MRVCVYMHACMRACICTHACVQVGMHACVQLYVFACVYIYIYTCASNYVSVWSWVGGKEGCDGCFLLVRVRDRPEMHSLDMILCQLCGFRQLWLFQLQYHLHNKVTDYFSITNNETADFFPCTIKQQTVSVSPTQWNIRLLQHHLHNQSNRRLLQY